MAFPRYSPIATHLKHALSAHPSISTVRGRVRISPVALRYVRAPAPLIPPRPLQISQARYQQEQVSPFSPSPFCNLRHIASVFAY